nr:MAG TPA: hypothetical protein [Caudoviricetes sp.]
MQGCNQDPILKMHFLQIRMFSVFSHHPCTHRRYTQSPTNYEGAPRQTTCAQRRYSCRIASRFFASQTSTAIFPWFHQ